MQKRRADAELRRFINFLADESIQISTIENILTCQEIIELNEFEDIFNEMDDGRIQKPMHMPAKVRRKLTDEKMSPRAHFDELEAHVVNKKYFQRDSGKNMDKILDDIESDIDNEDRKSAHQNSVATDWISLKMRSTSPIKKKEKKKRNSCCGGFFS